MEQEKDVEEIKCLIDGYDNTFWTCSVSKLGYSGTAIISRVWLLFSQKGLLIYIFRTSSVSFFHFITNDCLVI
jgi:hypothetical protein